MCQTGCKHDGLHVISSKLVMNVSEHWSDGVPFLCFTAEEFAMKSNTTILLMPVYTVCLFYHYSGQLSQDVPEDAGFLFNKAFMLSDMTK